MCLLWSYAKQQTYTLLLENNVPIIDERTKQKNTVVQTIKAVTIDKTTTIHNVSSKKRKACYKEKTNIQHQYAYYKQKNKDTSSCFKQMFLLYDYTLLFANKCVYRRTNKTENIKVVTVQKTQKKHL